MVFIDGISYNDTKFQAVVKTAVSGTAKPQDISELRKNISGIVFEDVTVLKRGNSFYLLSDRCAVGEAIQQGRTEIPVRIISSVALKRALFK